LAALACTARQIAASRRAFAPDGFFGFGRLGALSVGGVDYFPPSAFASESCTDPVNPPDPVDFGGALYRFHSFGGFRPYFAL
jgi:hypothetical protein